MRMPVTPHAVLSCMGAIALLSIGCEVAGGSPGPRAEVATRPEVDHAGMTAQMMRGDADARREAVTADEAHPAHLTQHLAKIGRLPNEGHWNAADTKAPLEHATRPQLMHEHLSEAPHVATPSATGARHLSSLATPRVAELARYAEHGVTLWTYQQLRYGMSLREVTEILGREGIERTRRGGTYLIAWNGDVGARRPGGIMMLTFQKDRGDLTLVSKSQFGLAPSCAEVPCRQNEMQAVRQPPK
jgi:hypothetical protein